MHDGLIFCLAYGGFCAFVLVVAFFASKLVRLMDRIDHVLEHEPSREQLARAWGDEVDQLPVTGRRA